MKRRRELIIAILRWLSEQPEPAAEIPDKFTVCPDASSDIVRYHIKLCEEAGFIKRHQGVQIWHQLTWTGHDQIEP